MSTGFPRALREAARHVWQARRSLIPGIAIGLGIATPAGPGAASSLGVQGQNVNTGLFAARVGVASSCGAELHEIVSGAIGAGDYVGCSSLTAEGSLATGAATFTAGDLVILRDGFSVATGATLTVEIDRALYPDAWVQDDTPDGETVYAARFFIDSTDLDLSASDRFYHFIAYDSAGRPEFRIGFKGSEVELERRLFFEIFQDDGSLATTEGSLELAVPPGWHWVDAHWQTSSSPGNHDAFGFICLDSTPPVGCVDLSNLDNDTGAIDFVRWGAIDVPSSSNLGPLDLDDFTSDSFDDGFESGSTSAWSSPGGGPGPDCSVPSQHPTIQAAVDFPGCSHILVAPGVYSEALQVGRTLTIEGSGGRSFLAGPLTVSGSGTELSLESFAIDTANLATPDALEVGGGATVYAEAVVVPEPGSAALALGCALVAGLARLRQRALPPPMGARSSSG